MPAPRSTGFSGMDAQHDFLRARRRATVAKLVARLRGEPDDVGVILPYSEVIDALGLVSERPLGLKVVALDEIVGTIDRGRDFDRRFRPTSARVRSRWEQIDVITHVDASATMTLTDLPLKSHERVFFERVPLPEQTRSEIDLSDPWDYAVLGQAVEAWGFRAMRSRHELLDRKTTAELWLETEYRPVVAMLRDADLIGDRTETEAYMHIARERYRLLRTHKWSDEVLQQVVEGQTRKRR